MNWVTTRGMENVNSPQIFLLRLYWDCNCVILWYEVIVKI